MIVAECHLDRQDAVDRQVEDWDGVDGVVGEHLHAQPVERIRAVAALGVGRHASTQYM